MVLGAVYLLSSLVCNISEASANPSQTTATVQHHPEHGCPHKANHGGRFSQALNDAYHVEGSYPEPGRFRLHVYGADSCPLKVDGFQGRVLLPGGKSWVKLRPASDRTFLECSIPDNPAPPVSLTVLLTMPLPDGSGFREEHLSYNFYRLSEPRKIAPGTPGPAKQN